MDMLWVNEFVGIPFVDRGRDANGADCWGLVRHIYKKKWNIDLPSWETGYTATDKEAMMKTIQAEAEQWDDVEKGQEEVGDVIIINMYGIPQHVGMVIAKGLMIHTHKGINSCIEKYDGVRWRDRVAKFKRYDASIS